MQKFNFYKLTEIRAAKKERRSPEESFSITTGSIGFYTKRYDLYDDYVWNEAI